MLQLKIIKMLLVLTTHRGKNVTLHLQGGKNVSRVSISDTHMQRRRAPQQSFLNCSRAPPMTTVAGLA